MERFISIMFECVSLNIFIVYGRKEFLSRCQIYILWDLFKGDDLEKLFYSKNPITKSSQQIFYRIRLTFMYKCAARFKFSSKVTEVRSLFLSLTRGSWQLSD